MHAVAGLVTQENPLINNHFIRVRPANQGTPPRKRLLAMLENPFDAPNYEGAASTQPFNGEFSLQAAISRSFKRGFSQFIALFVGAFVALVVMLVSIVTVIGPILVMPLIFAGYITLARNALNGTAAVGDIFVGFRKYQSLWLPMAIYTLVAFLMGMIPVVVKILLGSLGLPAMIVSLVGFGFQGAAMLLGARLVFTPWIIIEEGLSGMEALKRSFILTQNQTVQMLILVLVSSLIGFLGLIPFIIPVLLTQVIQMMIVGDVYHQFKGVPDASESFA